jgi:hypothetical protein
MSPAKVGGRRRRPAPSRAAGELKRQLTEVAEAYDEMPQLQRVLAELSEQYDLGAIATRVKETRQREPNPPDDLAEELEELFNKIVRLGNKRPEPGVYERKYPWRYQISLKLLISILIEILEILQKLYGRSIQTPAPRPGKGAHYEFCDEFSDDCGGFKNVDLPRSFSKVAVVVKNSGDCRVTATLTGFGSTPEEREKGKTTVSPADGFGHDGSGQLTGEDVTQVTFKCSGTAQDGKCRFSFSITGQS